MAQGKKENADAQEGDPRYMAPELLRGEYGSAADIFRSISLPKHEIYYTVCIYVGVPYILFPDWWASLL